ncbi:hypothetical protein NM680_19395, partial [Paracoccus sp. PS-1]|uniref:hypothetical protein n=1 Tax=Paracoccus sp. PS1 TaxID=2963938 RepID=UPI0027E585E4
GGRAFLRPPGHESAKLRRISSCHGCRAAWRALTRFACGDSAARNRVQAKHANPIHGLRRMTVPE